MSMSLPCNFNHQIYQSDLLVLFMVRKNYTTKQVRLKILTMKSNGIFDRQKFISIKSTIKSGKLI